MQTTTRHDASPPDSRPPHDSSPDRATRHDASSPDTSAATWINLSTEASGKLSTGTSTGSATGTSTARATGTSTNTSTSRATARAAIVSSTLLLLAACSPSPVAPSVSDWCWLHFGLAPAAALIADDGPQTPSDAHAWATWLHATTPAPPERAAAHQQQLELVRQFASTGTWTPAERDDYRAAALADPTPATTCETVGARIIPHPDGSLPADWDQRFLDPANSASSNLAYASAPIAPPRNTQR